MTIAKENAQNEFIDIFLNDENISEDIKYTPSGLAEKTIKAVVYRKGMKPVDQVRASYKSVQMQYDVEITISNTDGYGVVSVVEKSDKCSLPLNIGEVDSTWRVASILYQDLGCFRLGLVKA